MKLIKTMNRKGMMDDFFDFMFTVFLAVFLLLFISATLQNGAEAKQEQAFKNLQEFQVQENFLSFLDSKIQYHAQEWGTSDLIAYALKNNLYSEPEIIQALQSSLTTYFPHDPYAITELYLQDDVPPIKITADRSGSIKYSFEIIQNIDNKKIILITQTQ